MGGATPIYPYCQWLVGTDAFLAVTIYRQPIAEARDFHPVRFDTTGLGDDGGYIATTRAVFFGKAGVTYSILWQKVGDFTTVETEKLSRARARRAREGVSGATRPPLVPRVRGWHRDRSPAVAVLAALIAIVDSSRDHGVDQQQRR